MESSSQEASLEPYLLAGLLPISAELRASGSVRFLVSWVVRFRRDL